MPTYEYQCDACQHNFDEFQSITAEPLKKCPKCRKSKLRRVFGTGAAVLFKGAGVYQTDYRSAAYQKAAEADKKTAESSSSETKSSDTKSSDTKSSDKSSTKSEKSSTKSGSKAKAKATGGD